MRNALRRRCFSENQERAEVLPGNRKNSPVPKIRKPMLPPTPSATRLRGLLFDIVKMEERETWTARFLRAEPDLMDRK